MTTHASQTHQPSTRDRAAEVGSTAKEQTGQVADTAKAQAGQVAGTAKEQALDVAQDAAGQARNLLDELRQNVRDQVGTQRDRVAETLDQYSSELRQMADRSERDGPATEAVRQVAGRLQDLKDYLAGDGDVAEDVRRFARRRPGTFLLACAAAGVLAGRATRGAVAARKQDQGAAGRHVIDVREPATPGDVAEYNDGTAGGYPGGDSGPQTYGAQTYGTGDLAGLERTSDPNLRPSSGPLADRTEGYRGATGDPVPPDPQPGPVGVDRAVAGDQGAWDRGER